MGDSYRSSRKVFGRLGHSETSIYQLVVKLPLRKKTIDPKVKHQKHPIVKHHIGETPINSATSIRCLRCNQEGIATQRKTAMERRAPS